jgi:hypothetical protein
VSEQHIDDGGAAFPSEQGHNPDGTWNQTWKPGMSLRDWFAGQTLAGMIADSEWYAQSATTVAMRAYQLADAMIAVSKLEPK